MTTAKAEQPIIVESNEHDLSDTGVLRILERGVLSLVLKFIILFPLLGSVIAEAAGIPRPATDTEITALRVALDAVLKDAPSVRLRNVQVMTNSPVRRDNGTLCGELNARNSFGGYVGYVKFMAKIVSENDEPLSIAVIAIDGKNSHADIACALMGF